MPKNPPENMPRITPYLFYEDVDSILDWLARAFGFRERMRVPGSDGRTTHAEMETADGVVMMGWPGPEYRNPARLGHATQNIYVYVDDVEGHYEKAKKAGAEIIDELTDKPYGDRMYRVQDPEGHQWAFAEHVRDVPPEDLLPSD
jgi:uncharacterized glyoxalase superfamily protein PhnB